MHSALMIAVHLDFPRLVSTTILARMMTTNYNCADALMHGNVLPRESPQVLKAVGL